MQKPSGSFDCDLISKAECELIVRNSLRLQNVSIVDYRIVQIPGHLGFLGEYFQLEIVVKDGKTQKREQFFIKSLPRSDQKQRQMMEGLGFFRKEVRIYSEILANFGDNEGKYKWRPDCFHARNDVIVMEDLTVRGGYRMVHYKKALEEKHVNLVLQAVAQMHAESLNYEFNCVGGKRLDELFRDVLFETTVCDKNTWFLAGLSGIKTIALNSTRYCTDPGKRKIIEEQLDHKLNEIFEVVKPTTEFQSVLVHRDIWHNNLMFQFEKDADTGTDNLEVPKACVLLDFQICRYLPPIIDVLQILYLTTRRPHREKFFNHYLTYYYDNLTTKLRHFKLNPDQILSWEQLMRSMKRYKIIAHVFTGVYLAMTNLPEHLLDDLHRRQPELYNQYCNVNRDELILNYLREDQFYRETMTECVEEMLEYFLQF